MVNNPELINKLINNLNKLDDETIKEAIKGVESEDMEEDIKTIENIIDTLKFHIEYENYEENILDECKRDLKALENLLKRYKELEEENTEWRGKYLIELNRQYYFYIPKAKIKEIIENHYPDVACFKIQELLEERNK